MNVLNGSVKWMKMSFAMSKTFFFYFKYLQLLSKYLIRIVH